MTQFGWSKIVLTIYSFLTIGDGSEMSLEGLVYSLFEEIVRFRDSSLTKVPDGESKVLRVLDWVCSNSEGMAISAYSDVFAYVMATEVALVWRFEAYVGVRNFDIVVVFDDKSHPAQK